MQTIKPATSQLLCKPEEAEKKTASGFLLTKEIDPPKTAIVINVGNGVTSYKRDETVIYRSYAATEVKLNNELYILISEEDIIGTVIEC